jgi:hypothetical protein
VAVRRSALSAGGGLAIGAGFALFGALLGGPSTEKLGVLALDLDARVREARAAVEARTDTLAQLPRLAWAVATDEQTVLDLTADELAFKPQQGESIEIGQVMNADRRVVPLLHLGEKDVVHLPLGEPGPHLVLADDRLHVVMVAGIAPKTRSNELRGAVGVSRPVDLSVLRSKLSDEGIGGRLMLGAQALPLGSALGTADAVPVKLSSDPDLKLIFSVPRHGRTSLLLYLIALVIAAAGIGVALVFYRRELTLENAPLPELVPEQHD